MGETRRVGELPAVAGAGDVPSAFVDAVMMEMAQQNQIAQFGRSAIGPMDHVMGVEAVLGLTAWELAHAVIAAFEEPTDTPWHDAGFGTDGLFATVGVEQRCLDLSVATEPLDNRRVDTLAVDG